MRAKPLVFDWGTRDENELRRNVKVLIRFLSHCEKNTSGLLYWVGSRTQRGYGVGRHQYGRCRAHKLAYALLVDLVPRDMCVCHKNDDPACVDPSMLFLGTHADNVRDRSAKGRSAYGERHGRAKLTEACVQSIRRKYQRYGHPNITDLSVKYGVSISLISFIINYKIWKHIGA